MWFSDQHVSRVWSDLTPSRSPGLMSPRPKSPEGRRRTVPGAAMALSKVIHSATLHMDYITLVDSSLHLLHCHSTAHELFFCIEK
jgi:hypothetical protein